MQRQIPPPVPHQRLALAEPQRDDLTDCDRVVAARDQFAQLAHGPGQGPLDHRGAVLEPVRYPVELLALGQLRSEDARKLALLRAQDVDSKPPGLAYDREGPGLVFEADQR